MMNSTDSRNYLYDERDLLFHVTDANQGLTTYHYDPNGNLTSLKDANTNTTTYTYDDFDRLKETIYPDSSKETYAYDPASNLSQLRNPNSQVIRYTYDALNRLTFKEYVDCAVSLCGGNVDYVYDPGSRLKEVGTVPGLEGTVPISTIAYQYDSLNRVKNVTTTLNGTPFQVSYQYDAAGNRTQLTSPHGRTLQYTSDQLNRLDQIKDSIGTTLFDFDYDTLSRRTSLSRPNGISTSYTYDTLNRLTHIQHGSLTTISYPLYDQVGNRKQMTNAQGTHNYDYNNLYELTSASGATTASYNYDAVGNRTAASGTGTPSSYTPNTLNQYSSVEAGAYAYDVNGNLTNDGIFTYTYDYENRLVKATVIATPSGGEGEALYTYDPFGRRLTKTTSSGSTSYLYDGDQILEVYPCNLTTSTCSLNQSFLFGPGIDEPLELIQHPSGTTYYYHQDGLGSVTHLTHASGSLAESYQYDPYGIPSSRSTLGNPFLFTGREYDSETGLYYYRARYYHPGLGRFLSRDPLGDLPDVNLYRYVRNNPLNWIDPFGLEKQAPWWQSLQEGYWAGTGYGEYAAEWYAQRYVETDSWWYYAGGVVSSAWTPETWIGTTTTLAGAAAGPRLAASAFGRGGWLNRGPWLRVGFGQHQGRRVFRAAGRIIDWIRQRSNAKIDFWRGGPI